MLSELDAFDVSRNRLKSLPACFLERRSIRYGEKAFMKLDLSYNPELNTLERRRRLLGFGEVFSLMAIAAAAVLNHRFVVALTI